MTSAVPALLLFQRSRVRGRSGRGAGYEDVHDRNLRSPTRLNGVRCLRAWLRPRVPSSPSTGSKGGGFLTPVLGRSCVRSSSMDPTWEPVVTLLLLRPCPRLVRCFDESSRVLPFAVTRDRPPALHMRRKPEKRGGVYPSMGSGGQVPQRLGRGIRPLSGRIAGRRRNLSRRRSWPTRVDAVSKERRQRVNCSSPYCASQGPRSRPLRLRVALVR